MTANKKPPQTYYDSIASAASALGFTLSDLRKAKRDGAPGFRGSRVYPLELLPWLNAQKKPKGDSKEEIEKRILLKKERDQDFDFGIKRGDYILAADASRWSSELVTHFAQVLDAVPSTLAPDIVGLSSVAEAELRVRAALEEVKRVLHEGQWRANSDQQDSANKSSNSKSLHLPHRAAKGDGLPAKEEAIPKAVS